MAALSDFHRTKSGSDRHTSHAGMEQFQDNKWKNFALQSVKKWRNFHNLMIQRYSKDKICILQYEDLVMDVIHELRDTKHFERKIAKGVILSFCLNPLFFFLVLLSTWLLPKCFDLKHRPCLEFLGFFGMDPILEECILREQEGSHHRPSMSQSDLEKVLHQTFTDVELRDFRQQYDQILQRWIKK